LMRTMSDGAAYEGGPQSALAQNGWPFDQVPPTPLEKFSCPEYKNLRTQIVPTGCVAAPSWLSKTAT
jgi:hypothetical protein